jgi:ureidoglycolate lyase
VTAPLTAPVETPTPERLDGYGWLLGKPFPTEDSAEAYRNSASGFWSEHIFDPGEGGETEVLWVDYADPNPVVGKLETHHRTQQAVVPLTGEIIQILALSGGDGAPDLSSLRAFRLAPGIGLCMRPGVWHATRSQGAQCLMLTRRSTTLDLVKHLKVGEPCAESEVRDITPIRLDER